MTDDYAFYSEACAVLRSRVPWQVIARRKARYEAETGGEIELVDIGGRTAVFRPELLLFADWCATPRRPERSGLGKGAGR